MALDITPEQREAALAAGIHLKDVDEASTKPHHDDLCESEFIPSLNAMLSCGCTHRQRIDNVLALVRAELIRATRKFGRFASAHEGYAVLLEEVDELWDDVKANRLDAATAEAVQVAAMGARFVLDVGSV